MPSHTPEERTKKLLEQGQVLGQKAAAITGIPFESATTPSGAVVNVETGALVSPPSNAITGADLIQQKQPIITTPPPIMTPNVQGITVAPPPKLAEPKIDLVGELESEISKRFGGQIEAAKTLQERVTPLETQLDEISEQIKMLQSQDLAIEAEAEKRGVLQPFVEGEIARAKRQNAIEVLKLSARAAGIQGRISTAERQTKRAVDLEFAEAERDIRVKRQNVIANYDSFTPAQKKRADALLLELDRQDTFVTEQKKNREEVEKVVIKGAEAGADNVALEKAEQAKTAVEAAQILAPFLKKEEKVPTDIETFKTFFPNVDLKTFEGKEKFIEFKRELGEAGRKVTPPKVTERVVGDRLVRFVTDPTTGETIEQIDLGPAAVPAAKRGRILSDEEFRIAVKNAQAQGLGKQEILNQMETDTDIANKDRGRLIVEELIKETPEEKSTQKSFFGRLFGRFFGK